MKQVPYWGPTNIRRRIQNRVAVATWRQVFLHLYYNKWTVLTNVLSIDEIKGFRTNLLSFCTVQCNSAANWKSSLQTSQYSVTPTRCQLTTRSHNIMSKPYVTAIIILSHTSRFDSDYHYGYTISDVTSSAQKLFYICAWRDYTHACN
jgi:hypothetical protein